MAQGPPTDSSKRLQALQKDTEDLADAMKENVERVLHRNDNMDVLLEKGQQLDTSAQQFERVAVRTERKMRWKNRKMKVIIGAVVATVLLIIIIAVAVAISRGAGGGGADTAGGDASSTALVTPSPRG